MRAKSFLLVLFSTLFLLSCTGEPSSVDASECGDKCDEVWSNEVCPLDEEDWTDDLGNDCIGCDEEAPQGLRAAAARLTEFELHVIIGRDVVDDVSVLAEQQARQEIRRQGGDLAWVDLSGAMNVGAGDRLPEHVDTVMEALRLGLEATDAHIDITAFYNYGQVRGTMVNIAGRLVQSFPYRGRVRWRIGCRIQDERGIVYRRVVAPMIDGAIWSFNNSANYRIEDFLQQHGLEDRMTVKIGQTQQLPRTTTIIVRSKGGLFAPLTIPYSEIEKGVALIKEHLPRE